MEKKVKIVWNNVAIIFISVVISNIVSGWAIVRLYRYTNEITDSLDYTIKETQKAVINALERISNRQK